jgi:DHA2 family multidrug resistance protein
VVALTTTLPTFLQQLFNYPALNAGLVLSPGAIATMIALPFVGWALGKRLDARWMIAVGLAVVAAGSFWFSTLNLEISPVNIIVPRCVQMLGIALIFSPINVAAYLYLPREQGNNATGVFNMFRNEGSSFGVGVVTTVLARRGRFHQSRLAEYLNPYNPIYTQRLSYLTAYFLAVGYDRAAAQQKALGQINAQLAQQAQALSYFDVFWLFALAALPAAPMVLLMRRSVPEKGMEVHAH